MPVARLGTLQKAEEWVLLAASTEALEERDFVVDPGASMHTVTEKDVNSAELETMTISKNPTTVMTANGEVQTEKKRQCVSNNWTYLSN